MYEFQAETSLCPQIPQTRKLPKDFHGIGYIKVEWFQLTPDEVEELTSRKCVVPDADITGHWHVYEYTHTNDERMKLLTESSCIDKSISADPDAQSFFLSRQKCLKAASGTTIIENVEVQFHE